MNAQDRTASMLENTRQLAAQAMERAEDTAKELRHSVQGAASRGIHALSDQAAVAQRQLGQYAQTSTRYVAEHPMKSALIAAAVGAAIAGLVVALRRRHHDGRTY